MVRDGRPKIIRQQPCRLKNEQWPHKRIVRSQMFAHSTNTNGVGEGRENKPDRGSRHWGKCKARGVGIHEEFTRSWGVDSSEDTHPSETQISTVSPFDTPIRTDQGSQRSVTPWANPMK